MKLHIIDSNNWIRRVHETDTSGLALRNLFNDAYHNPEPAIWVFDGANAKAARRSLYPEYKANRVPAPDVFYETLKIFKELLKYTPKLMVEVPGYEADDVIATLSRQPNPLPILIRSNDGDLGRLCNERVSMTDPSKKLAHVPREEIRLYKTLVGDKSDYIHGIPGFGDKAYLALDEDMKRNWAAAFEDGTVAGMNLALHLGLNERHGLWVKENFGLLQAYWKIINFLDVPAELLQKHTTVGKPNMECANIILRSVMQ